MRMSDSDSAWLNGVDHVVLVREMEMADDVGNQKTSSLCVNY